MKEITASKFTKIVSLNPITATYDAENAFWRRCVEAEKTGEQIKIRIADSTYTNGVNIEMEFISP